MPSLFVIRGNDQGTRFELSDDIVRIGRDASNTLQIHDNEVSRHHAELRREAEGFTLSDLSSSNGTFVNGQRIRRHVLSSGDQIQLGSTLALYTGPAEESQEDLAQVIDIASSPSPADQSRIIRALPQAEGSRIFDLRTDLPADSWLSRARSNLQVMYRTAMAISHTLDIDQLLHRIMDSIFEWVEADRGCAMLIDPASQSLQPKVRRTRRGVRGDEKITISKTILDYVVEKNEGVLTSDARQDQRWDPAASILQAGIREAICVPMQGRYGVVGAIYIDTSTSPQEAIAKGGANKFTEDHLKLMVAIGHQAALAVEDTRYYSAMVQAERLAAVGQTVAMLSHHIKNILQGIRGGSYLIEMGLKDHDESIMRKGWTIVDKNQAKISSLVLDMLTFSKEREPDLCTANVHATLADVVELMQSRAAEMEVELAYTPSGEMPDMIFDPEGLHRAALNIMTNAIDAAHEKAGGGRVEVHAVFRRDDALVQIIIEDNGPGIPPEMIDQLFSPFVSTKKSRGTGLGLSVSQKIMTEHGGRIVVHNAADCGARFTLELPVVYPAAEPGTTMG